MALSIVNGKRGIKLSCDSEHGTRDHGRNKSCFRSNDVTGMFGALSVFGRRIKEMLQLRPEQVWTCNVTLTGLVTCCVATAY